VVGSKNFVEFYKWDIDAGPYVNLEADMWDKIEDYISANDISNAAALLRRGSEQFFAYVCHSLEAPVRFVIDATNNLGDLLPSAIGRYRSLLRKAKSSAQSWSNNDLLDELVAIESTVQQIYERTQAEKWAVNPAIHYNSWANFSKDDFTPVRDAFQDTFGIFICQSCGGVVSVVKKHMESVGVRCNCGEINLNLVKRKSA
jgi:hypothetical protein